MTAEADSAAFRRRATRLYRASLAALTTLAVAGFGLGWLAGSRWGFAAGLVISVVGFAIAAGGAVAATVLWGLSQDGG